MGSPPPAGSEKVVLKFRSVNNMVIAPASTGSDNKSGNAVTRTDHTNRGDLCIVIPAYEIVKQPKTSLEAFVDADWAKCLATKKFVTGFCIKLNGSLVSWKSKKHITLSRSSIEVEAKYRAMASVTFEVTWVLKVLNDLK
ncbi:hypothetical protein Tco_0110039 [Tanacetum coccineum]